MPRGAGGRAGRSDRTAPGVDATVSDELLGGGLNQSGRSIRRARLVEGYRAHPPERFRCSHVSEPELSVG
jgi:hypothetical protein